MIFLWKMVKAVIKTIFGLVFLAVMLFALLNWPVKNNNPKMPLGISFSNIYARDLGLDWKKAYVDILDGLGVKRIRLISYWTEIEKKPGEYDFSDLDWQIAEAKKRDIEIILAFGIKVPRWPECFVPEVYQKDKEQREKALLEYEKTLLQRYKRNSAIKLWQVENEPFLSFGNCPTGFIGADVLDREIAQTKKIDPSRPILTTDSGELSFWYQAARRGDFFGTTMYRSIYSKKFGYFNYPIGANFFRIKKWLIEKTTGKKNFMVIELQGEPWGSDWVGNLSWEEQQKTMNAKKLEEMVEIAQKAGFSESYLWGAEWWYWLKEKRNELSLWNSAKNLFKNNVVEKK